MLKKYRRRFVLSNMLLTGLVLFVSFICLGCFMYKSQYTELRNTMSMVIKPWNSAREDMPMMERKPPKGTGDIPPSEKPREKRGNRSEELQGLNKDITTVFYNKRSKAITTLSDNGALESSLIEDVINEIIAQHKDFGKLREFGVIYYKESTENEYKIALTSGSYLTSGLAKSFVILFFVFLASMGIIFFISVRLSKLASKPMEEAIEMERNFVADISHDLKTPITVILTNNSIIKSNLDVPAAEHKQWIDSTDVAAKAMMKMVSEMLTLSSLECGAKEVENVVVNLSSAAEKCVLQMESVAYERDITIEDHIEEDVFISASQEYTEKICSGLLDNALKYEPHGGKIIIDVKHEKKNAVLRVTNIGSSIDAEDLPHIFERFYRGDKTRRMKTGHGLGLPIINRMTELVGAEISVKSTPENGTTFTVVFNTTE